MPVMTLKSDDSCVLAVFCNRKQDGDTVAALFRGRGRQELIESWLRICDAAHCSLEGSDKLFSLSWRFELFLRKANRIGNNTVTPTTTSSEVTVELPGVRCLAPLVFAMTYARPALSCSVNQGLAGKHRQRLGYRWKKRERKNIGRVYLFRWCNRWPAMGKETPSRRGKGKGKKKRGSIPTRTRVTLHSPLPTDYWHAYSKAYMHTEHNVIEGCQHQ